MRTRGKPGLWLGLLSGLFLTLPLVATFYLGYRHAALPFPPFNLFDWQTRILPGSVLANGINTMVRVIGWTHATDTSRVAKLAEQSMAIFEFILAGMAISALFFMFLRSGSRKAALLAGRILGVALGLAIAWSSNLIETSPSVSPAARTVWIVLLLVGWGAALGWVYQRLRRDQVAAASEESATASAAERADRRRFLARFAGIASVITVVAAAVGRVGGRRETAVPTKGGEPWSATHPLPNADAAVQPAAGTRPELTPVSRHYRIDINTSPPSIPEASWRLKVHGLVARPLEWTLAEIRARPAMHQFITLSCISNTVGGDLIGTARWSGVSLQQLLPELGLHPNATHLKIHSADGFYEVVALAAIREDGRVMLTYAWDGLPLPEKHGFPLRIYIPDRYGMKQPKWIESIEAIDHWQPGYWVVRGWDREARMKATSVIDTIATNMMIAQPTREMRVPIGGIAHAGIRGISKVELRVDNGEWMTAELRTPLSGQTWVVWRCDWPMQKGKHTFTVRCFEGDGTPQIARKAPPDPSGASGLDTRSVML
ncbi:MAG TPA: molybdopterin-dependent oxidoreductase [Bryobacteraceae bacterium]|nr:molybdopterin-dependent oxidoreductase [Bryobacteraceae bacterium]